MKTVFGALALLLAVPAAAQTAPATDPHAGHAQHQQQGHAGHAQHGQMDHAKMMADCKKAMAEGKCKEHCQAMMKQQGTAVPAAKPDAHAGHAGHAD